MVVTRRSLSSTAEKALDHYHSTIKDQLSEDDFGRYIAIDAHTGDWLVGESDEVVFEMRDRNPCAHPVVIQYPNISTMRLGSRQTRSFK